MLAEREFKKLNAQSDYNEKVDELSYVGRLILSMIMCLFSLYYIFLVMMLFLRYFGVDMTIVDPIEKLSDIVISNPGTTEAFIFTLIINSIFCSICLYAL